MRILYHYSSERKFRYRDGAVPFTGKRSPYCSFRCPKTFQERREGLNLNSHVDGIPIHKEKLRSRAYLPSDWDDISRTVQRSWKEHRRNQWKSE